MGIGMSKQAGSGKAPETPQVVLEKIYARETVSAVMEKGGFPQLLLAPINFEALYQQHLAKIRTASPEASSDAKH